MNREAAALIEKALQVFRPTKQAEPAVLSPEPSAEPEPRSFVEKPAVLSAAALVDALFDAALRDGEDDYEPRMKQLLAGSQAKPRYENRELQLRFEDWLQCVSEPGARDLAVREKLSAAEVRLWWKLRRQRLRRAAFAGW